MTDIRLIDISEDPDDIDDELAYTQIALSANPLTVDLAGPFVELRGELEMFRAQRKKLTAALMLANIRAQFVDGKLNNLAMETKNALLAAYDQDYQHPLYKQLFEGQSPSVFIKPVLGDQLASQRDWIGPLKETGKETLVAIAEKLGPVILEADEVTSAQATATAQLDAFNLGPWTAYIARVNAARKLAQGKIDELAHTHDLGSDFRDSFFLVAAGTKAPKLSDVERAITQTKAKLVKLEAQRQEMQEKQARQLAKKQAAEKAERQAKLASARKKAAEAAAEIAKLEGELGVVEK